MKGTAYCIILGMIITGCSKHQTPITKRDQMMLLSKADEMSIGDKEYKRLLSCTTLCKDTEKKKAIDRVGKKLISVVKNSHIKKWEFILVEKDSINAACLPNGKVFINSGVFKVAKNDDQLATILAHEMSHALARHGGARISRNKVVNGAGIGGGLAIAVLNPLLIIPYIGLYQATTEKLVTTPHNRLEEKEADEIGLNLMKKAGYDLKQSIAFWENMKTVNKHKGKTHTKTHLSYDERIKDLQKVITKMQSI
ncbi:M48 family metallopeptidase [Poseidonibacter lekithochrous]|uniref:M48 family metallopeptidase n=1 Tax=Poseidonibacter lekithochrous TaxID=1904463 RepID=UPI0008FC828E|nr:M48 family metallopeptidase [Poseidonibacter lekithochrous]QKJ23401.1 peptidase, M48 family [Poseidonibacter lekithochrous]